jgi:hypothetical protein
LRSGGGHAVLIILYPRFSHALYLDPSKNIEKKDYTHIKYVLDRALMGFSMRGGYIQVKKTSKAGLCFGHKTDFCCLQRPATSENDGFYVIHLMMEYRRDVQSLCMTSSSGDAHIRRWAEAFGTVPDNQLRNDFYRIQQEIASIIMKDVLEENGMFYNGPISRADVRTRIALQRQDMTPFTKLGCILPDMAGWEECTA